MSPTDVPACPHAAAGAARRRVADLARTIVPHPTAAEVAGVGEVYVYQEDLKKCRADLRAFIDEVNCHPILLRLAWHDAGTFDNTIGTWPQCGGANGSIRFDPEMDHGANAGLKKAIGYLKQFNEKYPNLSWADLIQLAGATAIECAGGPKMYMRYGRVDTATPEQCPKEGNLPHAEAPYHEGADPDAATHLRRVFYRMGFDDREIVALSGAHTIGRAFKERSGVSTHGYGEKGATKFSGKGCPVAGGVSKQSGCPAANVVRPDGKPGLGMPGGQPWTKRWLTFDNSYYKKEYTDEPELLWMSTDRALHEDPGFKPHFDLYAEDQKAFHRDFAAAFVKLSECGARLRPINGIKINEDPPRRMVWRG